MKNIIVGFIALTMMSTTAVYAGGGKKKAKAKTVCTKTCPETKDCRKDAKCPVQPGCVCK